jgi:DNA-binding beta-propeller fold protein YncE
MNGIRTIVALLLATIPVLGVSPAWAADKDLVVVRTKDVSTWNPPSPDPTGLTYNPKSKKLLISDAEVDERGQRRNFFVATRAGRLLSARKLTKVTDEPEDLAWNSRNNSLYVTDDDSKVVYRVRAGRDGKLGSRDDAFVKVVHTDRFGSTDPEGLALRFTRLGIVLVITDATNDRVYKVTAGPNGRFDDADDRVKSFGMRRYGFSDTEDAFYDQRTGHLFVVGTHITGPNFIAQVRWKGGALVNRLMFNSEVRASGIVIAPGTGGSGRRFYVTDSGVRPEVDPNENDGRLLQLRIA